ncbi:hypothetical protein E2C01_075572 [Portunus trituberculatus]|uniref:Uncharacterized protein n=1 Tax=Portunus trituberculatus TaxID=210409 RepID=A0A5B7IFA7_PORTR|nr:hypothetical protein [Portunus trituberculatus]
MVPGARETTYWDYSWRERWLPWTGVETPLQSIPTWKPNHPAQDGPYWTIPAAGGPAVHWQPT